MRAAVNFFSQKKREMVVQCANMQIDQNQTNAFLDHIGIPEPDANWVMAYKDNPNYHNAMKM